MATHTEILSGVDAGLRDLASSVVSRAMKSGASAAEAVIKEGTDFSTAVRLGQVETLKESGSRAIGLRVFLGSRSASTYSSDLTEDGIQRLITGAFELARVTSEDPYAGIPEPAQLGSLPGDLKLYYDDVFSLPPEERIDYARRAERAALDVDPRLMNSDGGAFDASTRYKVLANSHGFTVEYRYSHCSISDAPIAQDENGSMQGDYWFSFARTMARLESPEAVGEKAAQRALRLLGARKINSIQVPVVLDPLVAESVLDNIFDAVSGDAVYRQASFLAGKLGEKVAANNITIIDDGTIPGGFGTEPFDSEGVPTQRTTVIENGVLKSYLLNTYTAKKLGLKTTGNASRGLAGNPSVGSGNFFLQKGERTPQQIISNIKQGLYVVKLIGFGVNMVTGDFSRGASGLWIENGELAYPVEEITIAGNLKDMLNNISEIGNDLEFRSSTACPTLRIDGMMIAGE